jgi:sugar/nucleoside kinase (ribokinase family)
VTPDLVCLGNLITDDIVFADGRMQMGVAGGAVVYAALGARLWGPQVGVVGVAGSDYSYQMLEGLARRGVGVAGIRREPRPGLRAWLLYEPGGRQLVHRLDAPPHAVFSPTLADLPDDYARARAFHLSPMPLASQEALAEGLARMGAAFVSVDPHEPLTAESLPRWKRVLARVDAFLASEQEVRLAGLDEDPLATLAPLAGGRLRFVALKRGASGGVLCDLAERRVIEWPRSAVTVLDPTGAGDAFGGGFVAGWLATSDTEAALERGWVSAGLALENWGAQGFMGVTPEMAEERRRDWATSRTRA